MTLTPHVSLHSKLTLSNLQPRRYGVALWPILRLSPSTAQFFSMPKVVRAMISIGLEIVAFSKRNWQVSEKWKAFLPHWVTEHLCHLDFDLPLTRTAFAFGAEKVVSSQTTVDSLLTIIAVASTDSTWQFIRYSLASFFTMIVTVWFDLNTHLLKTQVPLSMMRAEADCDSS